MEYFTSVFGFWGSVESKPEVKFGDYSEIDEFKVRFEQNVIPELRILANKFKMNTVIRELVNRSEEKREKLRLVLDTLKENFRLKKLKETQAKNRYKRINYHLRYIPSSTGILSTRYQVQKAPKPIFKRKTKYNFYNIKQPSKFI